MIRNVLLVGLGGAVGSMLRYGISLFIQAGPFPFSTLLINLIGSFMLGLITGLTINHPATADTWKPLLAVGLCGGFTTFSALSMEGLTLLQQQRAGLFFIYVSASITLGLLAAWFGTYIVRS